MIFSIAQNTGWTIDYIVWNLSIQQIVLLSLASKEMFEDKKNDEVRLEEADDPAKLLSSIFGTEVL